MKYHFAAALLLLGAGLFAQGRPLDHLSEKDGRIGIGTRSPDELLTVKGKIHTQEVLVDLNGAVAPDYVFEHFYTGQSLLRPDYKLRSLQELKAYLAANYHLPGIPGATALERDGMPLMEMNLKLLEKIEELTLYTLQQQSEIDQLREEIERIKQK